MKQTGIIGPIPWNKNIFIKPFFPLDAKNHESLLEPQLFDNMFINTDQLKLNQLFDSNAPWPCGDSPKQRNTLLFSH